MPLRSRPHPQLPAGLCGKARGKAGLRLMVVRVGSLFTDTPVVGGIQDTVSGPPRMAPQNPENAVIVTVIVVVIIPGWARHPYPWGWHTLP